MKIIITENQRYVLRRIQQFIDIVEDQIEGYENQDDPWWCSTFNPETFLGILKRRCVEEFIDNNWDFFFGNTENGESNVDVRILYDIVNNEYGNDIRNLFVRKCGHSRF